MGNGGNAQSTDDGHCERPDDHCVETRSTEDVEYLKAEFADLRKEVDANKAASYQFEMKTLDMQLFFARVHFVFHNLVYEMGQDSPLASKIRAEYFSVVKEYGAFLSVLHDVEHEGIQSLNDISVQHVHKGDEIDIVEGYTYYVLGNLEFVDGTQIGGTAVFIDRYKCVVYPTDRPTTQHGFLYNPHEGGRFDVGLNNPDYANAVGSNCLVLKHDAKKMYASVDLDLCILKTSVAPCLYKYRDRLNGVKGQNMHDFLYEEFDMSQYECVYFDEINKLLPMCDGYVVMVGMIDLSGKEVYEKYVRKSVNYDDMEFYHVSDSGLEFLTFKKSVLSSGGVSKMFFEPNFAETRGDTYGYKIFDFQYVAVNKIV